MIITKRILKDMTDLEKYNRVNSCETIEELCECIRKFSTNKGAISGRTRVFMSESMVKNAIEYYDDNTNQVPPNGVTRVFGLRQQLMYLKYYKPFKATKIKTITVYAK